jgi:hypothetical protein
MGLLKTIFSLRKPEHERWADAKIHGYWLRGETDPHAIVWAQTAQTDAQNRRRGR